MGRTRGEKVIAWIEGACLVPEGDKRGQPLRLMPFQKKFITDIYDNPAGTSRAYLSIARKNGKSALIAAIALAHICGPEAVENSQIICGARSRAQAGLIYDLISKIVMQNPMFKGKVKLTPSTKTIRGLRKNVEFRAISAEAATAHGLSPVLAILDEVGQIKGPYDAFTEAITTSQGAYGDALLIAISTQAATDNDLFSRWLDDADKSNDPHIVSHKYSAPEDCEITDETAWEAANPALGEFRSLKEMRAQADIAARQPSEENSFRWLYLNQRIDASAPFVSKSAWEACAGDVLENFDGLVVFAGLDLSAVNDLTAFVAMTLVDGVWHVKPTFWLPGASVLDKARADRVPYDQWHREGLLEAAPGPSIEYEFVAEWLWKFAQTCDLRHVAFDPWGYKFLKPWLRQAGFRDDQLDGDAAVFQEVQQGYKTMTPALRSLESVILNKKLAHGGHKVLEMCARNAVVHNVDSAGNRKLDKAKSRGRIDGMVALAMAMSVAGTYEEGDTSSIYHSRGLLIL